MAHFKAVPRLTNISVKCLLVVALFILAILGSIPSDGKNVNRARDQLPSKTCK